MQLEIYTVGKRTRFGEVQKDPVKMCGEGSELCRLLLKSRMQKNKKELAKIKDQ